MAYRFVFSQLCQLLAEVVSETYKPRNRLVGIIRTARPGSWAWQPPFHHSTGRLQDAGNC